MERDDHGQRHDVERGTMGAYINSSMVTGCAGSPLKGTNCKREWLRYQYTDKFMKQNPHLVQMALALTGDTQPNTELLYPYPWKKQFQLKRKKPQMDKCPNPIHLSPMTHRSQPDLRQGRIHASMSRAILPPYLTDAGCRKLQGRSQEGLPDSPRFQDGLADTVQPSLPRGPCGY